MTSLTTPTPPASSPPAQPIRLHRHTHPRRPQRLDHRLRNHLRCRCRKRQPPSRAIALQPVRDVEILLEVVLQREIEERRAAAASSMQVVSPPCTSARSQAARCRSRSGTNARTSTPSGACERGGIDAWPRHHDHPQIRQFAPRAGYACRMRRIRWSPTPEPPTVTMHTRSSSR